MSSGDEANRASVLVAADWDGTVDAAIRIHERISHELEVLQSNCGAGRTDRGSAEWAMRGKLRDAEKALVAHTF